jgi:hypothetical protein
VRILLYGRAPQCGRSPALVDAARGLGGRVEEMPAVLDDVGPSAPVRLGRVYVTVLV